MHKSNTALFIGTIVISGLAAAPVCYATTAEDVVRKPAFLLTSPPDKVAISITSDTTEQQLEKALGKKNVKQQPIGIGEGETVPGTVLFPNSKDRSINIIWFDKKQRRFPETVRIDGSRNLWRTNIGLKIGMSLKELHKSNDKSFTMSGFDWDYGGRVTNWNGGKLQKVFLQPSSSVMVQFAYGSGQSVPSELYGDREIPSSNPAMQKLNPTVDSIAISFDQSKSRQSK